GVGEPDCDVPTLDREWEHSLPPVCLSLWPVADGGDDAPFTSVLQWRSYADADAYGNKDRTFPDYIDLPERSKRRFRMALTGLEPERLTSHGWEVVPGWIASATPDDYQSFIAASRAEFAV